MRRKNSQKLCTNMHTNSRATLKTVKNVSPCHTANECCHTEREVATKSCDFSRQLWKKKLCNLLLVISLFVEFIKCIVIMTKKSEIYYS